MTNGPGSANLCWGRQILHPLRQPINDLPQTRQAQENKRRQKTMNRESNQDKLFTEAGHEIGQGLDETFGAGTARSVEGSANQALGRAEAQVGRAAGDPAVEFEG